MSYQPGLPSARIRLGQFSQNLPLPLIFLLVIFYLLAPLLPLSRTSPLAQGVFRVKPNVSPFLQDLTAVIPTTSYGDGPPKWYSTSIMYNVFFVGLQMPSPYTMLVIASGEKRVDKPHANKWQWFINDSQVFWIKFLSKKLIGLIWKSDF